MGFIKGLLRLLIMIWIVLTIGKWAVTQQPLETILKSQWVFVTEEMPHLQIFEEDK